MTLSLIERCQSGLVSSLRSLSLPIAFLYFVALNLRLYPFADFVGFKAGFYNA